MLFTRYNRNGYESPFALMNDVRREFDRIFADGSFAVASTSARSPKSAVSETDEGFVLRVEVPGLKPDALSIKVEDGVLNLAAERNDAAPEGYESRWTERVPYRFDRSLKLPEGVDADRIEANLKDGLLTVTLPKAAKAQPRQIAVTAG